MQEWMLGIEARSTEGTMKQSNPPTIEERAEKWALNEHGPEPEYAPDRNYAYTAYLAGAREERACLGETLAKVREALKEIIPVASNYRRLKLGFDTEDINRAREALALLDSLEGGNSWNEYEGRP